MGIRPGGNLVQRLYIEIEAHCIIGCFRDDKIVAPGIVLINQTSIAFMVAMECVFDRVSILGFHGFPILEGTIHSYPARTMRLGWRADPFEPPHPAGKLIIIIIPMATPHGLAIPAV